jgi:hypothetical protein
MEKFRKTKTISEKVIKTFQPSPPRSKKISVFSAAATTEERKKIGIF